MLYSPRDGGMWDTWMFHHDGTFHLYYLQSEGDQTWPKIGHATSSDMLHWTEQDVALRAGAPGQWDAAPLGTGMVFSFEGRFYLFYCALCHGARHIGLAVSDDLYHWDKLPENPVLVAGPPYESDPSQTCRGRVSWRDAYLFRTGLDDYVYASICARVLDGPRAYRGAAGLARSRDLRRWELLPPLCHPGRYLDMEVPEVFPMAGRWWMLFAAAFIYTNHRDTPRMPQCGGSWQMVSDQPLGGYVEPEDNLVLGSGNGRFDNYVGRHLTVGDEHFLYYQTCGGTVMAAAPKRLDVRGDRLVPVYWDGLDRLKGECLLDSPTLGRSVTDNDVPDADWRLEDGAVCVDVQGCSARRLAVEVGDCMIEARVTIEHGSGAGLLWRVCNTGPKPYEGVWLDAQRQRLVAVSDGFNSFWPLLKLVDASYTPVARGRAHHIRVMVRGQYADFYLDGVLHLSLSLGEPTRGEVGLFALDGRVRFTDLTVHALQ